VQFYRESAGRGGDGGRSGRSDAYAVYAGHSRAVGAGLSDRFIREFPGVEQYEQIDVQLGRRYTDYKSRQHQRSDTVIKTRR